MSLSAEANLFQKLCVGQILSRLHGPGLQVQDYKSCHRFYQWCFNASNQRVMTTESTALSVVRETTAVKASWPTTSQSSTSPSPSRLRWMKPSSLWSRRQKVKRDDCCWNLSTLWALTASSHEVWELTGPLSYTTTKKINNGFKFG